MRNLLHNSFVDISVIIFHENAVKKRGLKHA